MESARVGIACLVLFVLLQGLRDTYLGHLFGSHGVFEIALVAFATATILFTAQLLLFAPAQLGLLRRHWRHVIAVNVTTALAWLCYFGALSRIKPTAVNLVFSGIAPAAVWMLAALKLRAREDTPASAIEHVLHASVVGSLIMLAWVVLTSYTGSEGSAWVEGATGLALAALSGISITAETVLAKQMNQLRISAAGIVGTRFILIVLIATAVTANRPNTLGIMPLGELAVLACIFVLIIVVPIYIGQIGLQMSSPLTAGVVLAFGPAMVFALQSASDHTPTSGPMLLVVCTYGLLTVISMAVRAAKTAVPRE